MSLIRNDEPTFYLANPITVVFLVLALSIISSYISIDIYKTPIEDGSELLLISKPLNRTSIFVSKLIIIVLIGLFISIITVPIVALCFLFPESIHDYSITALFGTPTATLIVYFAFSSLGLFISVFFKKAIALISISIINLILLLFSVVNLFVLDIHYRNSYSISYQKFDLINEKNKDYSLQNFMLFSKSIGFKEYYEQNNNIRIYPKFTPINFYTQLGNLYSANQIICYYNAKTLLGLSEVNYPFHSVFDFKNPLEDKISNDSSLFPSINLNFTRATATTFNIPIYFSLFLSQYSYAYYDLVKDESSLDSMDDSSYLNDSNYIFSVYKHINTTNIKKFLGNNQDLISETDLLSLVNQEINDYVINYNNSLYYYVYKIYQSYYNMMYNYSNHENFWNHLGFFNMIDRMADDIVNDLIDKYVSKFDEKKLLKELNNLILNIFTDESIFGNSTTTIKISDIDNMVDYWSWILPSYSSSNDTTISNDYNYIAKVNFLTRYASKLNKLVMLKLVGFDLQNYFNYFLDQSVLSKFKPDDSTNESLWSYIDPSTSSETNSVYYSLINFMNYGFSSYGDFESAKVIYQLFGSPEAFIFSDDNDYFTYSNVSFFNTIGLYVGWICLPVVLFYLSFLLYRRKEIF